MKHNINDIVTIKDCKWGHQFKIDSQVKIISKDEENQCYEAQSLNGKSKWAIEDDEIN